MSRLTINVPLHIPDFYKVYRIVLDKSLKNQADFCLNKKAFVVTQGILSNV